MKKSILFLILVSALLMGFFILFKPDIARNLQKDVEQTIGPKLSEYSKGAVSFAEQEIKEKSPEIRQEFEKETKELKLELFGAGAWLWNRAVKIIKNKFLNQD